MRRPPRQFAADARASLAVSPSGTRLYAVSPLGPTIAELDPTALEVGRVTTLPRPDLQGASTVRATVTDVDTLYVAFGPEILVVDLATMSLSGGWTAPGVVTGLEPSNDRGLLYVSLVDGLVAVDPRTGAVDERFTVPTEGPIDHVAPALRPICPSPTCAAPADG